ncbi:hypothetical protein NUW54_g14700 [Trametes sanguinea]|uniref:Uncharacterized protein n=1 Tax=Trametes sanguinea TaxID=158606 RepID=A0ACC1MAN4_9APHY|nr:hypothetical protein NUW54_g14700 [Trametes sanguinea]
MKHHTLAPDLGAPALLATGSISRLLWVHGVTYDCVRWMDHCQKRFAQCLFLGRVFQRDGHPSRMQPSSDGGHGGFASALAVKHRFPRGSLLLPLMGYRSRAQKATTRGYGEAMEAS